MAEGDVVADTLSVGAGAQAEVQPASGVEWLITAWAGQRSSSAFLRMYDGTDSADGMQGDNANVYQTKVPITNAQRVVLRNDTAGAIIMGYRGVILKD